MAATVVFSKQDQQSRARPIRKFIYNWTSHTDGAVALATPVTGNEYASGEIVSIETIPNGAPDAPDDNYDLTIINEQGIDVAKGLCANRDVANAEAVYPVAFVTDAAAEPATIKGVRPIVIDDKLRIVVANAGSGKKGKVVIVVR